MEDWLKGEALEVVMIGEGVSRGGDNHGGVEERGTEGERTVLIDQGTITPNAYKSAKGGEIWQKQRLNSYEKFAAQNVMTLQPGPTAYATRITYTISDTFQLFLTPQISGIILTMSNKEVN